MAVRADVVTLNDGRKIEGDLKRVDGGWRITTADGKQVDVRSDEVKSIVVGSSDAASPGAQAMSNLLSLRRSTDALDNIPKIIDRFKQFVEQYKGTPAAEQAKADLAQWQQRLDQGLVKLGTKWVTAQEREGAANQALAVADQARQALLAGRVHVAEPLLQQALDADPNCVPALYLRGVMQYELNQMAPAKKSFETVNSLIKDHAPTLNNLSVILSRQNAQMPSLNVLSQALIAAPVNKTLLDNAAEALAAVPDAQKKNPIAQRLFRVFTEQDARLQEIMAAQGWYRWGGTWIDKTAMERMRDVEKAANEKIAAAQADGTASQKKIADIDNQIQTIESSLRQIEAQSFVRDAQGNAFRVPYPTIYYSMQEDERRLQNDRATESAKMATAQDQLRQAKSELPRPKFTGVETLIAAEGTPQMLPPPAVEITPSTREASTEPATVPSTEPAGN